jgi:hypothetical protein
MTIARFVVTLFLALTALEVLSSCSRVDAAETQEPAATAMTSTEIATPSEGDPFLELRSRRLRTPALRPGAYCPNPSSRDVAQVPGIPAEAVRGTGPVYFAFPVIPRFLDFFPPRKGSPAARSEWRSAEVVWLSDSSYRGPVLVRGRQVDGEGRVGFGSGVQPEFEFRLPAGRWAETREPLRAWGTALHPEEGWRVAIVHVRVRQRGCYFFQMDGTSFSSPGILFGVNWQ